MRTTRFIALMIVGLVAVWAVSPAFAQENEKKEEKKQEKAFAADKGAATIDVSGYPKEMQENYEVFAKRCAKCHTLARPINSNYSGDDWKRYVGRMMRKPGSGINPGNGKKIIDFLVYDSDIRKKGGK